MIMHVAIVIRHSVDSDNLALQAREPFILLLISLSELPTIKIPN